MKNIPLLALFMITSCTVVQKKDPVKLDRVYFDKNTKDGLVVNSNIIIKYRSCYTSRSGKDYDHFKPLKAQFFEKYNVPLKGLAEANIKSFVVKDSSIWVPNERCAHITASPMTSKKLEIKEPQTFKVDDEREHVH